MSAPLLQLQADRRAKTLVYVGTSHASIVNALTPPATATLAVLVSGDRPSARFWLAALIGSGTVIAYVPLVRSDVGRAGHAGDAAGIVVAMIAVARSAPIRNKQLHSA